MPNAPRIAGVGLGLRWEFLDEVLDRIEQGQGAGVPFFEIAPENYARRGGHVAHALERIAAAMPLVTHGLTLGLGDIEPFDPRYVSEIGALIHRVASPWHSDHLCFGGLGGAVLHDLLPLPFTREAAAHAARRAREIQDRFEVPFAVENVTHYLATGGDMDEADFLGEVLEQSGAGLLLDVNNAFVNGQNYGFDPQTFLARLPLDRVVQMHVAGHTRSDTDEVILDTHGADVIDPVLDLLAFAIERTGPVPVVLERDHRIPSYEALLDELGKVRAAVDRGLAARAEARAT